MQLKLTDREEKIVLGVFEELLSRTDSNTFLGSETINTMQEIVSSIRFHIRFDEYCKERGTTYEEMTEDEYEYAYEYIMGE